MRFLIVGLGSMGKRRVRNLQSLGYKEVTGFDPRADRRKDAGDKYSIETIDTVGDIGRFDAVIISTPPDRHNEHIRKALDGGRPCFVEASVILKGLAELDRISKEKNILVAPSCTFRFHPTVRTIKEIIVSGRYGRITNLTYHSGQYLPDWHPWEDIRDFYVSKRETGGAREIVPFELTWLLDLTGMPAQVQAFCSKTLDMGVDIDDTYTMAMRFAGGTTGCIVVDVVARFATRSLLLNLEKAQIRWDWNDRVLRVYEADSKRWINFHEPEGRAEAGYNANIVESMYVDEMRAFIGAVKGEAPFPNTLVDDIEILEVLERAEASEARGMRT